MKRWQPCLWKQLSSLLSASQTDQHSDISSSCFYAEALASACLAFLACLIMASTCSPFYNGCGVITTEFQLRFCFLTRHTSLQSNPFAIKFRLNGINGGKRRDYVLRRRMPKGK
ncbi:hypothetical protein TNCV_4987991 [Trichonephila clavipes]|nr:hypothetical protein TNCV_4987991 [Trichonephila clavipes]